MTHLRKAIAEERKGMTILQNTIHAKRKFLELNGRRSNDVHLAMEDESQLHESASYIFEPCCTHMIKYT